MDTKIILGTLALVGSIGLVATLRYRAQAELRSATEAHAAAEAAKATALREAQRARRSGDIVYARRFEVREPFRHVWCAEQPLVRSGWLLVVGASTEHLQPKQTLEPVLYVGDQVVDRVNTGKDSGKVVCIVPSAVDLTTAPVFFGDPALPERLRPQDIDAALAAARQRGLRPVAAERLAEVVVDDVLRVDDEFALRLAAMDLVETWSPQEKELVDGWRVPVVGGR